MVNNGEELQLERLRDRLWRARGRRSRFVGSVFLGMSMLFLILAYITRYIVFEVMSIVALFLGVVLVFTGIEPYMREVVGNEAVASPLVTLNELLEHLSLKGNAAYLPPANEAMAFIPIDDKASLPTMEEASKGSIMIPDKGMLTRSTGAGLLQLYEKELGDLRNMDSDYFMEWLPRTLVDGLNMCEKAEITVNGEEVLARVSTSVFRYLCQQSEISRACRRVGCPLSSSIASALAKNRDRVIHYRRCAYNPIKRETIISYRIGQSLETSQRSS